MHNKFDSPRDKALFEYGRNFERQRIMDALSIESLDPKYDHPSYREMTLGLKMALDIVLKLSFPGQDGSHV